MSVGVGQGDHVADFIVRKGGLMPQSIRDRRQLATSIVGELGGVSGLIAFKTRVLKWNGMSLNYSCI